MDSCRLRVLLDWLASTPQDQAITISDAVVVFSGVADPQPQSVVIEVARALTSGGWRRTQERVGGVREWIYRRDPNWKSLVISDSTKDAALADYSAFADQGQHYLETRVSELTTLYGQASAGVSAILQTAAHALAAARYCTAMARRTGDSSWLTLASQHGRQAVACELDASALCAKESKLWAKKQRGIAERLAEAFETKSDSEVDERRPVV